MNILTTGNKNYGLAQAIDMVIGGDFISRETGYDLCNHDGIKAAVELSLKYDIFINSSALWRFNQTMLLEEVATRWHTEQKTGHIINIGSTADTGVRGSPWRYPIEKKSLKDYCRNLSYIAIGGVGIRISYISYGYLATPKVEEKHPTKNKITPEYAANVIKWVIDQPATININEISLDPIQELSPQ